MLVDDSTTDDAPFRQQAEVEPRPSAHDAAGLAHAELVDLLALLREDVRFGVGKLRHELGLLADDATSLERAVGGLDRAGHRLASHAAAQTAALPRFGMLRRLLDRQLKAVDAVLDAAGVSGSPPSAAEEARQLGGLLTDALTELEAAFAPQPAHTEALGTVVEVGALRLGVNQDVGERLAATRHRLERFESRLLLALRPPGAPERRREPRLPVRIAASLRCGDRRWTGQTVDLARGGALVAVETAFERPPIGGCAGLELAGLGVFAARIVGLSAKGVHLGFEQLAPERRAAVDGHLAAIAALDAPFFQLARWAAREVEASFARGVAAGQISDLALFASPAALFLGAPEAAGMDPSVALAIAARAFLGQRLAPLQAQIALGRREIVYATCTDRHGYLAVVTPGPAAATSASGHGEAPPPILAMSGSLDESYDGMLAARARQQLLAHTASPGLYEIAVPITVEGRHWGAFRIGFRRAGE